MQHPASGAVWGAEAVRRGRHRLWRQVRQTLCGCGENSEAQVAKRTRAPWLIFPSKPNETFENSGLEPSNEAASWCCIDGHIIQGTPSNHICQRTS